MSGADLPHLNLDLKIFGILPDQFAKINATIGSIVERAFSSITLKLYVADLHVQIQGVRDGPGPNHKMLFLSPNFVETFQITFVRLAHDGEKPGIGANTLALHLQAHELAAEGDFANVEAAGKRLNDDKVSGSGTRPSRVFKKLFARAILETDLYDLKRFRIGDTHRGDPVVCIVAVTTT